MQSGVLVYIYKHIYKMGDFFSYYLFGNTDLNSWCTFLVLFHCQTSSVWSIIKPWIVVQTNNACKSLNFIIKMHARLRKFIARFFHFMASLVNPIPWDDIQLFFCSKCKSLTCITTCGFNKTVPHDTQHAF